MREVKLKGVGDRLQGVVLTSDRYEQDLLNWGYHSEGSG